MYAPALVGSNRLRGATGAGLQLTTATSPGSLNRGRLRRSIP